MALRALQLSLSRPFTKPTWRVSFTDPLCARAWSWSREGTRKGGKEEALASEHPVKYKGTYPTTVILSRRCHYRRDNRCFYSCRSGIQPLLPAAHGPHAVHVKGTRRCCTTPVVLHCTEYTVYTVLRTPFIEPCLTGLFERRTPLARSLDRNKPFSLPLVSGGTLLGKEIGPASLPSAPINLCRRLTDSPCRCPINVDIEKYICGPK